MSTITGLLKDAEINIMSILTNDSGEFGTVRMLVSDVPLAKKVFEDAGYQVHIDRVIGIYMEDRCGGLNEILQSITDSNITATSKIDKTFFNFIKVSPFKILIKFITIVYL